VTSAGGTTLPGPVTIGSGASAVTVNIPAERAWGWDWLWPAVLQRHPESTLHDVVLANTAGTGGGFSSFYKTPGYQQGVPGTRNFTAVQYLTPIDSVQANGLILPTDWDATLTPATVTGHATGRAVPDLATDADPETGYLLLYTFGDSCLFSDNPCGNPPDPSFQQFGGTSFVAPQLNGVTAVYDSVLGHRIGFWNPWIYKFAQAPDSPFTPLDTPGTSNDNLFYSGTPGMLYNPGSGLGTPDLAKLEQDFAQPGR
jgi:subtilase family serine protease